MAPRKKIAAEDLHEKKMKFEKIADNLELLPADQFLKDNFLPYAWSYNLDRALVDVTGLKPVQRRIIYTMFKASLSPQSSRSKVATLAGRVLAFHPHGDASVAEALKNLAREHIFRVPLIDGRGDFGVPGTPGAAARYLEARLNKAAWINVEEIAENAITMVDNYDGTQQEPTRIPVRWPISIINGGSGIAIAYASNMPSHNPTEIMKACKLLLSKPESTHAAIQKIIVGPDFNMGGLITSNDGIKEYMETGSGTFKIRAKYDVTPGPRNISRIEFNEIPYGTYPEKIIEEIQKQYEKGQFKEISSYKDLSDLKHPIRIVIETKPSTNYKKVLQDLFKYTSLEVSFAANITTIVDNKPKRSSMKELLLDFIEFRKMCITNKSRFSLTKKNSRLHLINGLMLTLLDIDKAIAIIRAADNSEIASQKLQKTFKIDDKQAEYVLSLQLRRLTKMDKYELENEKNILENDIAYLNSLLVDPDVLKEHLRKEFDETAKIIGDERKTEILGVSAEEFAEQEKALVKEVKNADKSLPCVVTRFADGRILKQENPFAYGNVKKLKYGPIIEQIKVNTQDSIVLIGSDGIGRRAPLSYFADSKICKSSDGGIKLPTGVKVVGICKNSSMKSDIGLAIATKNGGIKIAKTDFPKMDEFPVIILDKGDEVVNCRWIGRALTNSCFALTSKSGNILIFDASTIRVSGSKAGSVRGMKLKDTKDEVISFEWVRNIKDPNTLIVSKANNSLKLTPVSEIPRKGKAGMGVLLHGFAKGETNLDNVYIGESPLITLDDGSIVSSPPTTKRAARGTPFNLGVVFGVGSTTPL